MIDEKEDTVVDTEIKAEDQVVEDTAVEDQVSESTEVAEKPKKKKSKKKVVEHVEADPAVKDENECVKATCVAIGSTEDFEVEITKANLATFSPFRERGTSIRLKGATVRYTAKITKEQFETLKTFI